MPLVGRLIENKKLAISKVSFEAQPSNKILKRSYLPGWQSPTYIVMTGAGELCILDSHFKNPRFLKSDMQESGINNLTIHDFALITKSDQGSSS